MFFTLFFLSSVYGWSSNPHEQPDFLSDFDNISSSPSGKLPVALLLYFLAVLFGTDTGER